MTVIIAIAVFIAAALVGWCIAEGKAKTFVYKNNADEEAVLKQSQQQLEQSGYTELGIKDVIKTIATTGYSAV